MDQRHEQEFAEYFAARRDAVRRTAFLMCGDWHRADDLAQTAFIALHRRWRKIRDKGALDAYVRRTVVRSMIDESRRPWRRERYVEQMPESAHSDGSGGDRVADSVATRSTLVEALREVPPRQRAVLVLRFLEGLDVTATAEALKCSEGTVKSQTARGLAALRDVLGDALDDLRSPS
ncbi:RNA polymerase sigma-70 factor (sigma-E family) [Herbihabitans rhizosphaerae]|uniref:RNA polymerase sigma-70 factor (Sigma-E family) n=1 Tax=Herbihabitans rhizosphaerae TaxID=1872711 RepID=A0A4Q7KZ89_9PSEU|nr:SigE family RNA polymerase sigma factor [Herbihabitans rhizosphaerae]RZS41401.1 RNA polymerase sigma-70 factor (sigma-E family) [Herbihabitans rhizosphaerae]